jgi:hypothetical protein
VPDPRWQEQHLAGAHHDFLGLVLANPEMQRALDDVCELFVVMLMARHDAALLQIDVRQHHPIARDQPPRERAVHFLLGHGVPGVAGHSVF